MRIFKMILTAGIAVAAIKSCDIDIPFVTREALETAQSETRDATISRQSTVIAVQKDTISEQLQTILRQKAELKRSLEQQTEMVYLAGCDFERLGDEGDQTLNVTGRKDKEMVRAYKKAIYEKANQFFQQAASMNHAGAKGRCEVISYKIASL